MHEALWNGLLDVRWEDAPLGPETTRLVLRLRECGYAERTCRDYGHAVIHLGRVLREETGSVEGVRADRGGPAHVQSPARSEAGAHRVEPPGHVVVRVLPLAGPARSPGQASGRRGAIAAALPPRRRTVRLVRGAGTALARRGRPGRAGRPAQLRHAPAHRQLRPARV